MKKITLIAAAALTASSAFAAAPTKVDAPVQTMRAEQLKQHTLRADRAAAPASVAAFKSAVAKVATQDDEVEVTPDVRYVPAASSFYSGMGPATNYFQLPLAFTGIRNAIGFRNLTQGADSYLWTVGKVTGLNEDRSGYLYDYTTSEDTNLFMELNPLQRYAYPMLTATFGEDEINYQAGVNTPNCLYYAGRSPFDWGWDFMDEGAEELTSWDEVLGLSPCSAIAGASLFPEFSINRPGSTNYNASRYDTNGTSLNWYDWADPENGEKFENMVIKSFGTYIPSMPSAYQMDAMWFWYQAQTTADVTLTINVYAVNAEGNVDYDTLLGTGEVTLPEGTNSLVNLGSMPVVELFAVDADGYAIDSPVCVGEGQPIFVSIEGVDNEAIQAFDLIAYDTTSFPIADRAISSYLYPSHAYTIINADLTVGETTVNDDFMLTSPYMYYPDDTKTSLIKLSDFDMFFDINFPIVMNVDENSADYESANFSVELPAEGGEVVVPVACDYKIDVLMQEELVTSIASDWITYNQTFDEEQGVTNVTIAAAAQEANAPERTGYVIYQGYGIDFAIVVTQAGNGDSGIDSITVKPVKKGTMFFDMQGRRLSGAPANGMYIESVDGKATKQIAR